jgi:hypothetical protein
MNSPTPPTETAVDDVRRIREQLSREAGGEIRRHVEQTQEVFLKLQSQLRLRLVSPPMQLPSHHREQASR